MNAVPTAFLTRRIRYTASGAVDFRAMTRAARMTRAAEDIANVTGLSWGRALRMAVRDSRKPDSGPLPF
jgi:hypothetical protein